MGRFLDAIKVLQGRAQISEAKLNYKPVAPPRDDNIPDPKNDIVNQSSESFDVGDFNSLNDLTQLSERRDQKYQVFDSMRINDSLAAAVLEIYADDITQPNPQGHLIWAESDDSDVSEAVNRLIRVLKIEEDLWSWAYSLVLYGDVYLETFRIPRKGSLFNESIPFDEAQIKVHKTPDSYDYKEYVEKVDDPSEIYDIVYQNQTVAFVRTHVNSDKQDSTESSFYNNYKYRFDRNDIDLYDSRKFIHIRVPDAGTRHPYKFILPLKKNGKDIDVEYKVDTGKSILQDAYKVSQQLQLSENAILLSRLTRASLYRIIQVMIGNKSEKDALSLLNRVKSLFDKKQTINATTGKFSSYNNPGPEISNIVVPVKDNGQGGITVSSVGGDYDPKSLADLDYLINKELASFKVPRQFLNFTDGGGFNGGASLAKISAQYAHRIVRFKNAIISGLTDLMNYILDVKYPDYIGKFELKMTPVTTVEDAERVAMASDKLNMVGSIMDQLDEMQDTVGKFKILKDALDDAYPNSMMTQVLGDYIKKLEAGSESGDKSTNSGTDIDVNINDKDRKSSRSSSSSIDDLLSGSDISDETSSDNSGSEFPTDLSGEDVDLTDTSAVDELLGTEG